MTRRGSAGRMHFKCCAIEKESDEYSGYSSDSDYSDNYETSSDSDSFDSDDSSDDSSDVSSSSSSDNDSSSDETSDDEDYSDDENSDDESSEDSEEIDVQNEIWQEITKTETHTVVFKNKSGFNSNPEAHGLKKSSRQSRRTELESLPAFKYFSPVVSIDTREFSTRKLFKILPDVMWSVKSCDADVFERYCLRRRGKTLYVSFYFTHS